MNQKNKILISIFISLCLTACFNDKKNNTNSFIESSENILSDNTLITESQNNITSDNIREYTNTDFSLVKNINPQKKYSDKVVTIKLKGENLKGYIFQSTRKAKKDNFFAVSGMKFFLEKDENNTFLSSDFFYEDMLKEIGNNEIYTISIPESDYKNDNLLKEVSIYESISTIDINSINKKYKNIKRDSFKRIIVRISEAPKLEKINLKSEKRWSENTHKSIVSIAAKQLGLSENRIKNIEEASYMPDIYQAGFENGYNLQWSHAYMINSWGKHIYGDAPDDFKDNLEIAKGKDESKEGYKNKSASFYYDSNNQEKGDWYLGYALHFIEDTSLLLHTSFPSFTNLDLLTKHFAFENWIENNIDKGFKLLDAVKEDAYYYKINDPLKAIHNASYISNIWTSELGEKLWNEYKKCNYPENEGEGSEILVKLSEKMLINASRYAKGTIIYMFDKYNQWENKY